MDKIRKIPLFYSITLLERKYIVCSLLCKKLKDKYGMISCEGIYGLCRFDKMAFAEDGTQCSDLFILKNKKQAKLYLAIRLKNKELVKETKVK
jgi:hypothetical protein